MLCQALNQLDAAEVRFDNGFLTAFELDAAYRGVVRVLLAGGVSCRHSTALIP